MQLALNPLLAVAWRGPGRVQIGLDPEDGFILDGVTPAQERLLDALVHGTDARALHRLGVRLGASPAEVDVFVEVLAEHGALLGPAPQECAHLASVAAAQPGTDADTPWDVLRHRREATVMVIGGGSRAGLEFLHLLRDEGVGRILVDDDTPVTRADVSTGHYTEDDLGLPRMNALDDTLPGVRAGSLRDGAQPDLAVLVSDWALAPRHYEPLLREDVPHLAVVLRDRTAQVGPYVVPGRTGCLRCTEMYRADRDPDWVTVLAQLGEARRRGRHGLLQRLVTSTACAEALSALDGREPATLGCTLELSLSNPVPTLRAWPAHARCGCTWDLAAHG